MIVNYALLKSKRACQIQLDLWLETFGKKDVKLTLAKAKKYGHLFDADWAAENLLNPTQRQAYLAVQGPARQAYEAVQVPAWQAYETTCAIAFVKAANLP
jgi:hypothetical protein